MNHCHCPGLLALKDSVVNLCSLHGDLISSSARERDREREREREREKERLSERREENRKKEYEREGQACATIGQNYAQPRLKF